VTDLSRPAASSAASPSLGASAGAVDDTSCSPILEVAHLRKLFPVHKLNPFAQREAVHAVEDTSLALYPGRATALVGESGSGKTTVARMLAQLYTPTSGAIVFDGRPVNAKGRRTLREYRRHVQMIFQDPFSSLNPVHDVLYHLSRPLRVYGHARGRADVRAQALALLERVSLTPAEQFLRKFPHELSGGQRQRVAIARALAVRPRVLLADEPVSMLDVSIRLDILNLLSRLKEEDRLAILFITHDIASARYFAEETLVMYAGQTVEGGLSEEITQRPMHPYTRLLLSAAPDPDRLTGEGGLTRLPARGEIPSLVRPPSGCRFHPRCPHAMPVCRERFPQKTSLGGGHWVNCFLYGDGDSVNIRDETAAESANGIAHAETQATERQETGAASDRAE
jgi:peptide/nickel transport system ATP-binding protein